MAISDFDPLLIDVFKDASTKDVDLPFPNGEPGMKAASNMRQTFYRLRMAMREEWPPGSPNFFKTDMANRVSVVVIMKKGNQETSFSNKKHTPYPPEPFEVILRLAPQGSKYGSVLEKAGYKIPSVPELD